jgi:hypothetical protein
MSRMRRQRERERRVGGESEDVESTEKARREGVSLL